jgi:hypothetical protein
MVNAITRVSTREMIIGRLRPLNMGSLGQDYNMRILRPGAYNRGMPLELHLDDVLRLRKPHPCGGYEWRVVRLGADIGLVCLTCGRRVMLTRREVEKRTKTIVARAAGADTAAPT